MKDFAYSFYRSAAWKKCRQSYIDKRILIDGGLCEECHERAGYIVHHRTLLTPANIRDPEVSLNHANLEFVCKNVMITSRVISTKNRLKINKM